MDTKRRIFAQDTTQYDASDYFDSLISVLKKLEPLIE